MWPMRASTIGDRAHPRAADADDVDRRGVASRGRDRATGRRQRPRADLLDEVGDARRGVGTGERPRAATRIAPSRAGLGEQRVELGREAGAVELGVGDDDGRARGDERVGVARSGGRPARRAAGPARPGVPATASSAHGDRTGAADRDVGRARRALGMSSSYATRS